MQVAIVGATGQVGVAMRQILDERGFPADEVRFFASSRSAGTVLPFADARSSSRTPRRRTRPGSTSRSSPPVGPPRARCAPFVDAGVIVVDNSSAFRKDPAIPLVVSEVNPEPRRP